MKRNLIFALVLLFAISIAPSFAQKNLKFGHIDSQQLMTMMPEREAAKKKLEQFAKQLEDQLGVMQKEFESKYNDYVSKADSINDLIRETKERELQDMQKRVQTFQQTAQQNLAKEEEKLMQPVIDKAKKAIEDVAKENNFTYIFDVSMGGVLYYSTDSQDILPLVKVKLGIK